MRAVLLTTLLVLGCGGEDVEGPLRGRVTIETLPGARVDFMSARSDAVIISTTTDAEGRVSTVVDNGDRAVIIAYPLVSTSAIAVIDELVPEQTYHWYFPGTDIVSNPVSVTVQWTAVAGAGFYQVESRCGGSMGTVFDVQTSFAAVCTTGDALLVLAFADNGQLLASAYELVPPAFPGQTIVVMAPFVTPRQVGFTLRNAPPGSVDSYATLYTAEGVRYQLQPELMTTETVTLPEVDATVRVQAMVLTQMAIRNLIDQGPVRDEVTLDFAAKPLPDLVSSATFHEETNVFDWQTAGDGFPDAAAIDIYTAFGNLLTVIAPYRGPRIRLPPMPPDLGAMTPSTLVPVMLASPGGYAAAVSAYGRFQDPSRPPMVLYMSSYYSPGG